MEIDDLVQELAVLRNQRINVESVLKPLKAKEENVKANLLVAMQAVSNRRTDPNNGFYAIRKSRDSYEIVDEEQLALALEESGQNIENYRSWDKPKVGERYEAMLKETGEILPGVLKIANEYVSLLEDKGK
jgi:hypothetical protein